MQFTVDQQEQIALLLLDPSGRAADGVSTVKRYGSIVGRQHRATLDAWQRTDYPLALVELHFMLIAVDRVKDGFQLAAAAVETLHAHAGRLDLSPYKRARDHFEHIEDRVHGTRKNALKPVLGDDGTEKVTHYALRADPLRFEWSNESIDITPEFLRRFEGWVEEGIGLVDHTLTAFRTD